MILKRITVMISALAAATAFTMPAYAEVSTQLYGSAEQWAKLDGNTSNVASSSSNEMFGYTNIDGGSGWVNTSGASVRSFADGTSNISGDSDKCLKSYSGYPSGTAFLGYISAGYENSLNKVYRYEFDFKTDKTNVTLCAATKGSTSSDLTSDGIDWNASTGFGSGDNNLNLSANTAYHIVAVFDNVNRTATYAVDGNTIITREYSEGAAPITGLMIRYTDQTTVSLANLDIYSSDSATAAVKVDEYSGYDDGSEATAFTATVSGTGTIKAELTVDGETKTFENAAVIDSTGDVLIGIIIDKANAASAVVAID